MMDRTQRIEAAAKALARVYWGSTTWAELTDVEQGQFRRDAGVVADSAYPEFSDLPTHWMAPMEASEAMQDIMNGIIPSGFDLRRSAVDRWRDMRLAHLEERENEH